MKLLFNLSRIFLTAVVLSFTQSVQASDDNQPNGPSSDYTYKVIGSIGAYNIPDNTMTYTSDSNGYFYYELPNEITVKGEDGSEEIVPLTGTVFFYICEVNSEGGKRYYGSPSGGPTPITGSNTYAIDTDIKQVESFYFTVKPGYKYTFRLIGEYITVVKENASPFYLEAGSIDGFTQGVFSPRTGQELSEDAIITSVKVSVWDIFGLEQPTKSYLINRSFTDTEEIKVKDFTSLFTSDYDHSDRNTWMRDSLSNGEKSHNGYPTGEYMYKLDVRVMENNRSNTYTSYSNPFTIKNPNDSNFHEEKLILEGFYLVHDYSSDGQFTEEGSSEESLNGIYYSCDEDKNAPLYLITDSNAAQGHSGVLTFEKQAPGTTVDLGDEEQFRFTDCVLLRTYAPNRIDYIPNRIVNFSVYVSDTEDGEGELIATDNEYYENKTLINSNLRQTDSDYRLMMIVNDCPLEPRYYWVEMDYRMSDDENDETFTTITSNKCKVGLTLPSPRIKQIYTQFYKGATGNQSDVKDFTFKGLPLKNARYHNLRQIAFFNKPNVTEKMGPKMQESEGGFSYFCKFKKDETEDIFSPIFQDWKATTSLMKATYLMPGMFDEAGFGYDFTYTRPVYDRWGEKVLSPIELTLDAPACSESSIVQVRNSELAYNRANELMEKFQIFVSLNVTNSNSITYMNDKDVATTTDLIHLNNSPSGVDDYFYVTVVDTDKRIEGEEDEYEIVTTSDGSKAEYVVSRKQLTSSQGKPINFNVNHGSWHDGQLEEIQNKPLFSHLQVRVSYLYPFNLINQNSGNTPSDEEDEKQNGPSKASVVVSGDDNGEVLASYPAKFTFKWEEIFTSVESVSTPDGELVKSGKGYIELLAEDARIYSVDGVLIAKGSGRHEVARGTYIVLVGDKAGKVFVL